MQSLPYLINAFVLCVALIPICARSADRIGLLDQSSFRKRHVGQVPVVGGIAMFAAVILTATMLGGLIVQYGAFFAAMSLLVGVGIIDDNKDLGAAAKAIAQFAGAMIMTVWGGVVIVNLGDIAGPTNLSIPFTGIPFTVFCVVGLINALNMADGADGLAGGISLTALAWFLVAAVLADRMTEALVLSVIIAAVLGFMLHNMRSPWRPRAAVFMGDAGSMMLGFALAWFAVSLSQGEAPALPPVSVLWILALPTVDAMIVFFKRLACRRSPFEAGVDHLHHVLQDRGFSVQQTVHLMVGASALLGGIGILGMALHVPAVAMFVLFLVLIGIHFAVVSRLGVGRPAAAGAEGLPARDVEVSATDLQAASPAMIETAVLELPGEAPYERLVRRPS